MVRDPGGQVGARTRRQGTAGRLHFVAGGRTVRGGSPGRRRRNHHQECREGRRVRGHHRLGRPPSWAAEVGGGLWSLARAGAGDGPGRGGKPQARLAAAELQGQMSGGRTGIGPTWCGDSEGGGRGSRESQEAEIRTPTFSGYVGAGGR